MKLAKDAAVAGPEGTEGDQISAPTQMTMKQLELSKDGLELVKKCCAGKETRAANRIK